MTTRRMLSPEEAWIAAVDMTIRDTARYVESLSPEEVDAELRAMGMDPEVIRADGRALAAQYLGTPATPAVPASDVEEEPSPEPKRARILSMIVARRSGSGASLWLFAAALAAAAVLGAFAYVRRPPSEARLPTAPTPSPAPSPSTPIEPPSRPAAEPSATPPDADLPIEPIGDDSPRKYLKDTVAARVYGAAQKACEMEDWGTCQDLVFQVLQLDQRYWRSKSFMDLRKLALLHMRPIPPEVAPPVLYDEHGKPVSTEK